MNQSMPYAPRPTAALISLVLLLSFGTVGYRLIEGWAWIDAFYMVILSITTVGFGEVHPLSDAGRLFTTLLILGGVGIGSYVLLTLTRFTFEGVVEGSLRRALTRRRVEKLIPKLKDHTIVCGYGRLGEEIAEQLLTAGDQVVIVDPNEEAAVAAQERGLLFVLGDASNEDALAIAGIKKAKALAIATPNDAVNTYVALTARDLNPTLHILARASDESAGKRICRAGANRAVSPYRVGGQRMAAMLLRPEVTEFLELAQLSDFPDFIIEQLEMCKGSKLAGQSLREGRYNAEYRVMVLSMKHDGGDTRFSPNPDLPVNPGDILIVAGHRASLERLKAVLMCC